MVTTPEQIQSQLGAMAVPLYEVQPLPFKGCETLRRHGIKKCTTDNVLVRDLTFLRGKNYEGYDIYIRPFEVDVETTYPLVFVDDFSLATADQVEADGLTFCVLNESSPGNFQGWIRVSDQPLLKVEASAVGRLIAQRYGADPGCTDWRHYGRLAGFTNRKPSRILPSGKPPYVMLTRSSPMVAPEGEWLISQAREMLEQEDRVAARIAEEGRARLTTYCTTSGGKDALTVFLAGRAATVTKLKDDESARDFGGAMAMLRRGFAPDVVADALRTAAGKTDNDGKPLTGARLEYYVNLTVGKADARVTTTEPTPRTSFSR